MRKSIGVMLLAGLAMAQGRQSASGQELVTAQPVPTIAPQFPNRQSMLKALNVFSSGHKGEFESTKDFGTRTCDTFFKSIGGTADTIYHFPVFGATDPLSLLQPFYDADKQEYRFVGNTVFPGLYFGLSTRDGLGLILNRTRTPGKSYVGQNAFGVAKEITVSTESTIAIIVPGTMRTSLTKFTLHADPDLARQLKGDLRLIVSTRVSSSCVEHGRYHSAPTIEYPTDSTDNLLALIGSDDPTWEIIKVSTGEILSSGGFQH